MATQFFSGIHVFSRVHGLRAAAAILVLLSHAIYFKAPRVGWMAIALGGLTLNFFLPDLTNARRLALGIGFTSLLVAVADGSIVRRLGDASYGIYLIHVPIMTAISPAVGLA